MERLREPRVRRIVEPVILGESLPLSRDGEDYRLGFAEGWMPVFDPDKSKPWDEKLYNRTLDVDGKTLHLVGL